jgi:hypothetical protein
MLDWQIAIDHVVETKHFSGTRQSHQLHLANITRLKTDGRSRSYVQPKSHGHGTFKFQGAVYFRKMIMASDLYGPVSRVGYMQFAASVAGSLPVTISPGIIINVSDCGQSPVWCHPERLPPPGLHGSFHPHPP